jgi:outer membrane lipoprotein-sorting protein
MSDIPNDELILRLERLGAVTPSLEGTHRAVERVRRTLAENPITVRPARWSLVANRWAAVAAVMLVAGGLSFWLIPAISPSYAWADVQSAMKSVHSVSCRQTVRAPGQADEASRTILLDNGLCRIEDANGDYTVADFAKSRQLHVDVKAHKAELFQGLNHMPPSNLYETIKNLPNDATARPLPGKKIDGRAALGFVVKFHDLELTVWADAGTRLPVRIEAEEKDKDGKKIGELVIDDFAFDKEPDAKLFSLEPPAGYAFQVRGVAELPPASAEAAQMRPTVEPLVGIGPVKFSTSIADVEKLFGKADSVKEVGKNGYTEISYASRGIFLGAGKMSGVVTFTCVGQAIMATKVRDFAGQTDKGIRIGSSSADVIRAYGEPGSKEANASMTTLYYNHGQCYYTFVEDKLVQMTFNRPRPAK